MWPIYLVGGLATMGVLVVAVPLLAIKSISFFAEAAKGFEVEDDET